MLPNLLVAMPGWSIAGMLSVATLAATLVAGCAGVTLLSDKEFQEAVSTDVKRKTLAELDPQISDHYRRFYGDRFANPNLTYVPDVLLGNLIARTKGPAFAAAAAWNVPAVLDCRFPALTKPILDQLSRGDRYVILLPERFANASLGTQEKFILVHEVFHFVQFEQDQTPHERNCSEPSVLEAYIERPEEREAYKAEMRYAQAALKMTWERYVYSRLGISTILNTVFRETLRRLWDEVDAETGRRPEKSASVFQNF